ncbi:glycosyltransferase family 39 protein [Paracoccus sp. WLY502]|uniref:ArnT family glycosyltransferase n=1 Tax=Paracoccus yibinensis TaxID=3068891 RepID=UPI0027966A0E|nr:glycosyltransferase family 39 protein [Paracoccus sp. WLY502]MDQ1899580.1 glycosyltransferase family 39 protein [Paracoccus sp. WLY502]
MRPVLSATLLFTLTALTLILLRPLMPVDETRYMAAAWEMRIGGSPWVPHLNGALYGHKPPLLFWLINLVWALDGIAEFPARLIGPTFAAASVALTGLLARRLWPNQPARAGGAALILAVSPVWLLFGSATMFDAMLTCATLLSMLALWSAAQRPRRAAWAALGAAVAFGVYAKGPVILLHVLPAALAMPVWAGAARPSGRVWATGLGLALLVALLLVGLWLVPALILGGADYRTEVLWRQSGGRMVASFAHQKPWWFFLALLPLMIWPFGWTWSGFAALRPRRLLADRGTQLVALWAGGALAAFSLISGKQAHYLLPEMPALALLMAGGLPTRKWRRRDLWLALPLLAALAGFGAAATGLIPAPRKLDDPLPLWSLVLGSACLLVGIVGFLRLRSAPVALAALPLALMIGLHLALSPLLFARYDMTALGQAVSPFDRPGIAVTDGTYHAQLNFAGRLRNPVARLAGPEAVAAWRQAHPDGLLLDRAGLAIPGMIPVAALPYRGGTYSLYRSEEVAP